MKKIIYILLGIVFVVGCTKRNCVKTSDIAFADLNESDRAFYSFARDSFTVDICQYITPNDDGVNDSFAFATNVKIGDFASSNFRVVNSCEDIIHVQKNSLPFTFPNPKDLEDGQYNFTYSVLLLESKDIMSGSGVIRILRK